ncbi:MAG: putative porin [Clostridiales bacterium]|nr:putative porin [Clostridiales bacterium]
MSLEAVKQVTEAEERAKARKAEAQQEAKKLASDAEKAGQATVQQARQAAGDAVAELMAQAEQWAGVRTNQIIRETEGACDQLRAQAQQRLEQAASLIVERVVNA